MIEQLNQLFPKDFTDKLSERARASLLRTLDSPQVSSTREVRPLHLLQTLESQRGSLASQILRSHRFHVSPEDPAALQSRTRSRRSPVPLVSPYLVLALKRAAYLAAKFRQSFLGTEHLLAGIIDVADKDPELRNVLAPDVSQKLRRHLDDLFASSARLFEIMHMIEAKPDARQSTAPPTGAPPALTAFAQDLVAAAGAGRLDPVIGREKELERLIAILIRRTKNNPLLVGDPGVGKTAVVMGLAERIAEGRVLPQLENRKLYLLDMGLLVAGTTFRGEFEARLKEVVREAKETSAILFIDEFHTVIGAGSAPGSLDAANMLKPALASGEIQCIGATTYHEYRQYIERDAALERRMQPIFVSEPSREETLEILQGLKPKLETHHGIRIPVRTLEAAVRLAPLYLPERFFPDRAIDLIDESASRIRARVEAANSRLPRLSELRRKTTAFEAKKLEALENQQYDLALQAEVAQQALEAESQTLQQLRSERLARAVAELTEKHLTEIVAEVTGIPSKELSSETTERFIAIQTQLKRELIGQPEAIGAISAALRRAAVGLNQKERPLASFLFLGPKGVGKTECARILSRALFGARAQHFLKLDMSEFSEAHTIARLIGAPPGYVGYEEGGLLTERVRRHPQTLILFDEIERAHPKVSELLLHILEDGRLTDSQGRSVSFKETIIILTSNSEAAQFTKAGALGFQTGARTETPSIETIKARALKTLRQRFSPELIDRIDRTLVFKALDKKSVAAITTLQVKTLLRTLKAAGIALTVDGTVLKFLAEQSYRPEEGAREVRRTVEAFLEEPLTEYLSVHMEERSAALRAQLAHDSVTFTATARSVRSTGA
ncbi:MAG: ATP-dependent Clp protease ATP-binding subunit [bacterium]|nr:ATP-dependent Clp protease ATP-binding subunit [bacterium]